MMVIFSLILALLLLTGIIYALRQHQARTRQELAARQQPLPPLIKGDKEPDRRPAHDIASPPTQPVTSAQAPVHDAARKQETKQARQETAAALRAAPGPALIKSATANPDWRQQCQALRDQGRFEEALSTCRQAWPQWQSFDHAARVMRAAIRHTKNNSADQQLWLRRLYTLAAQASFLHDKADGMPDPTRQLLMRRFTQQQVEELDMPWSQIGYQKLRLLTRSDCKQLTQLLGEPEAHQSARIFHGKQWLTSIS